VNNFQAAKSSGTEVGGKKKRPSREDGLGSKKKLQAGSGSATGVGAGALALTFALAVSFLRRM
jgi:hypothetical protein